MTTYTNRTSTVTLFGLLIICVGMLGVFAKLPPMNLYADNSIQIMCLATICLGALIVSAEETILFYPIKILLSSTRLSFTVVHIEPIIWAIGCISLVLQAYGYLDKVVALILQ